MPLTESLSVFTYSFFLGLSLIVAIGAQNAFVLKQGLLNQHVFWVCLVCAVSDALLIALGVYGFKAINAWLPAFAGLAKFAGALFLLAYGARCFYLAVTHSDVLVPEGKETKSLVATILVCLAFTWLNPHVYLDTVVLMGSVSLGYPQAQSTFVLGAVCASFVFFFALGYGAGLLRPFFARPQAWQVLNTLMGMIMWGIAYTLI